ncbi:MAG: NADH-quinone oxidoreductase subunit L, partial [bacterium]
MGLLAKIHPESYAHWIVLLPFLSFVYITLKLVVNKNVTFQSKKREPQPVVTDPTKIPPAWKSFLPVFYVVLAALLILALKKGGFNSLPKLEIGGILKLIFGIIYVGSIFLLPFNSRKWIQKFGPYISVCAIGIAGIIATLLWLKTVTLGLYPGPTADGVWGQVFQTTWFSFGDWKMDIGLKLDGFGIFGAWMVTVVATCIQWFSLGYMWDDDYGRKHIGRYFAEHSLFVTGMLMVVLSDNILTFLIGWEVMGLCSYLLIGFFTHKPSANAAQVKAFIVTRIGDVGFMLGIFMLGVMYHYTKNPLSFDFEQIRHVVTGYDYGAVKLGWLPTAAALLIFMGAVGKSAQFPLHVWLPDAMEGPTPVSALIHAATMVAAGVFLVARFYWLFEMSQTAMMTIAWIGAITAFGAATIGLVQYDIKRILAYSTISQLGYMMIGLGVGSVTAGVFHLLTHAYFKALLFLGSGAVIYGCRHIQDIRYMGGLAKKMPITYWTFLAGTLALAGVFPFAGFWSKDEILASAFHLARSGYSRMVGENYIQVIQPNNSLLIIWFLGLAGAFLTAFYMFRLISYVFLGPNRNYEFRGKQSPDYAHHPSGEADTAAYAAFPVPDGPFHHEEHGEDGHIHPAEPREVPKSMWIPLVILAAFSLLYGFFGMPFLGEKNLVAKFLNHGHAHFPHADPQTLILMLVSLAVALAGWHFGLKINNTEAGMRLKRKWKLDWPGLYRTIYNKYFIDEFYEEYIVHPVFMLCQATKA